ncbi:large adhesive protein, partial [Pseudomonas sp. SDI]|uniref:immunoglobulin-like domain-containing protein n=1 Tax=Pseudomonas sp. SDI TaxID=2170734 RepID=UPI000DE5C97F
ITKVEGGNYEKLEHSTDTVTTTVTDVPGTADTTGLSLTATGTVAEGGQITYTATLSNPAGTAVTVNLSNGQSIVIAAGQTSNSISVAAPKDDAYLDAGDVSVKITNATGGDFEKLDISDTAAVTHVTDTIDTSTVTLTASPSVNEGGNVVYTASVTAPVTGSPLTVTLANGQTITIGVGESSNFVEFKAPNNVLNTNEVLSNSITKVEGGNYEKLEHSTDTVTTTVTDVPGTVDTTGLSLTATGTVAEGGQITYTATLSNPAGTAVTVNLSNGQSIVIAAGQTSNSISVAAPKDDAYLDAGDVSVKITNATGGDFEKLDISDTAAVTHVTDTIDTSTVTLTASPSVNEGGNVVYTASVTAPVTGSPLTVTLANGQTITIGVGESSNFVEFKAPNNVLNTNEALSNSITKVEGGNYEKLEHSTDTVTTTVTDVPGTADTTGLSLTATGTVAEGGQITYTATLSNPAGTAVTVNLSNGQSIVIAAGQTSNSISVAAPKDDAYLDAGDVSVKITNATGGDFEKLDISDTAAVTHVTDTIDTSTITLTASPSVNEGGNVVYTASVTAPVTGSPLTVTLANGQTITIGVGESSNFVEFKAPNNVLNTNEALSNSITKVEGGNYEKLEHSTDTVTTTVTDVPGTVDTTGLSLTATGTVAEGGQITYTATLSNPAGTAVTVNLSNGQSIVIAAGQTSNSISVAAPKDDAYLDAGDVSVKITNATGGDFEKLDISDTAAVTHVTDTIDTSTVTLTASPSVNEGGNVVYTASVTAPVTGSPLTVTLANGQTITIGVGESSNFVEFKAPNNVLNTNEVLSNSITKVEGGNYEKLEHSTDTVTTTVTDVPGTADTTGLSLTATGTVAEGGQITYTATLSNPAGTAVTVNLSNGQSIVIAAGQTSNSISVAAPKDDAYIDAGDISVKITNATGGDFEKLDISDTAAVTRVTDTIDNTAVTLTATPSAVEGGVIVYTASVGAPVTGSPVVVNLANGQSITIGVGQSSNSVNYTVTNDVYQGHAPVTNSITTVSGGNYENLVANQTPVSTSVTDKADVTTVSLSASTSVAEGGQIVYTATLNNAA